MDATWAAAVTGSFAILMLLIEKGRREKTQTDQHQAQVGQGIGPVRPGAFGGNEKPARAGG